MTGDLGLCCMCTSKWAGFALQAFKGIKSLLMSTVFSYTNSKGENLFWPGIQYAGKMQALCCIWCHRLHGVCYARNHNSKFLRTIFVLLVFCSAVQAIDKAFSRVGPDPRRPKMPSEVKLKSEQAICAASMDLNDCRDAGDLRQSLESLQLPAQVRTLPNAQRGVLSYCFACDGSLSRSYHCAWRQAVTSEAETGNPGAT